MVNKAYLAGSLKTALVVEKDSLHMVDIHSGPTEKLDGYIFSQLRAINPEIREVEYKNQSDLAQKLLIESVQQEALSEALELMDQSFSEAYRNTIAEFLIEKVKIYSGLIDFLTNRFYSNSLPEEFNEMLALIALDGRSDSLIKIYEDLRIKTEMFDRFYTLFQIKANLPTDFQIYVDDLLTESSAFAHFTLALFTRSAIIYEYATTVAVRVLHQHQSHLQKLLGSEGNKQTLPDIDKVFFNQLKEELLVKYKIVFNQTPPLEEILLRNQFINVLPYNFFGSSLRTLYNISMHSLPISFDTTMQVLMETHSPFMIPHESVRDYQQRLYFQSKNDLDFLADVEHTYPLITTPAVARINELQTCMNVASKWRVHQESFTHIPAVKREKYAALLSADCSFINRKFDDAILLYSDLNSYIISQRSTANSYDDLIAVSGIMVRLGKSYEMINDLKKATIYYRKAYRKLSGFVTRHGSLKDHSDYPEGDELFEPSPVIYIEAVAERVAGLLVTAKKNEENGNDIDLRG